MERKIEQGEAKKVRREEKTGHKEGAIGEERRRLRRQGDGGKGEASAPWKEREEVHRELGLKNLGWCVM